MQGLNAAPRNETRTAGISPAVFLVVEQGHVAKIDVYADAMEWNIAQVLPDARLGCHPRL